MRWGGDGAERRCKTPISNVVVEGKRDGGEGEIRERKGVRVSGRAAKHAAGGGKRERGRERAK
jgi:hypothetical protein